MIPDPGRISPENLLGCPKNIFERSPELYGLFRLYRLQMQMLSDCLLELEPIVENCKKGNHCLSIKKRSTGHHVLFPYSSSYPSAEFNPKNGLVLLVLPNSALLIFQCRAVEGSRIERCKRKANK